ncbi:MAG: hypothetical protein AB1649_12575 [Chloroflexota bacterium]
METTLQPSPQSLRTNLGAIEAIELAIIGLVLWGLFAMTPSDTPNPGFLDLIMFLMVFEGFVFASWGIYNAYIRIARAVGSRRYDVRLWIAASALTASYTFWAWTILDVNRWLIAKFLYRGEAPVEYAWSSRSKQVRKAWEQVHKAK